VGLLGNGFCVSCEIIINLLIYSYHFRTFQDVFTGVELIDWLMERGLVNSREDGTSYGDILLRGQVIEHVLQEHYFHDDNYFYHVKSPS